ncbi:hypothetical protein [Algiphilus aromaticivorans]|uniref:hypothetical protein n=1 Tax=Algiphilus aromaticivorans TaxID=382454 RepID=UPI0005C14505|nr:hypothetical protein [Algiphilus aromaticivorans]
MIAGRLSAGVLLGFPLACAVGGLIIALTPGSVADSATWAVLLMPLLWVGTASAAVGSASGRHAWLGLAIANAAAFALLWGLRLIGLATGSGA